MVEKDGQLINNGFRTKEETRRLTAAYSEAFQPGRFRDEWMLFMQFVDPVVDNLVDVLPGTATHRLLVSPLADSHFVHTHAMV